MGRYIERVENIARLLSVTEAFSSVQDGEQAWRSILKVLADEDGFRATGREANARNVTSYFLARAETPSSIVSCLGMVKENARSLRHLLSTEAWVQISGFHARISALSKKRIALSDLSEICESIRADCHEHFGVMEATCYRDEVWLFNRIGASLERADQMTRLIDMKYFQIDQVVDDTAFTPDVAWWNTLLRSASGYQAFRRRHSFNPTAEEAAVFFLFDQDFPRSFSCAIMEGFSCLDELERDYSGPTGDAVAEARSTLAARISQPATALRGKALHNFLDEAQNEIIWLSNALVQRYFSLEVQLQQQQQTQS